MNEEPHQPLEITRRDIAHQLEWLERHGTEVTDLAKWGYDLGLIEYVSGPVMNRSLQAVVESRIGGRKKSKVEEAAESTESRGNGPSDFMDGSSPQLKKQATQKRGKKGKLSLAEKLAALDEWDRLDRDLYPIKLDEWLEKKFGEDNGVLRVAVSTFH